MFPKYLGGLFCSVGQNNTTNGSEVKDATEIGVADQCRHLFRGARRRRAVDRRRRAPTGSDQRYGGCVNRGVSSQKGPKRVPSKAP